MNDLSDSFPNVLPFFTYFGYYMASSAWFYLMLTNVFNVTPHVLISPPKGVVGSSVFAYTVCSKYVDNPSISNPCSEYSCVSGGLVGIPLGEFGFTSVPSNQFGFSKYFVFVPPSLLNISEIARAMGVSEWSYDLIIEISKFVASVNGFSVDDFVSLIKRMAKVASIIMLLIVSYHMRGEFAEFVSLNSSDPEFYGRIFVEDCEGFRRLVSDSDLSDDVKEAILSSDYCSVFAEISSGCECFYDLGKWSSDWLAQTAYNVLYNYLKRGELGNCSGSVSSYISDVIHEYLDRKMGIE